MASYRPIVVCDGAEGCFVGLGAHVKQILSPEQVRAGVRELAERITAIYGQRPITIVAILTGSLVLLADLMRQLEMPLRVAMVQGNRHRGTAEPRPGLVISDNLLPNLKGREVLVIDDIFDTGHTLVEVLSQLLAQEPTSIRSAVLMRKIDRSEVDRTCGGSPQILSCWRWPRVTTQRRSRLRWHGCADCRSPL